MIAFETESLRELADSYRCVELITDIDEIPHKVQKILEDYKQYRQRSFAAYERVYNLDKNFPTLMKGLEQTIDGLHSVASADGARVA